MRKLNIALDAALVQDLGQQAWVPPTVQEYVSSVEEIPEWLLIDMFPADSAVLMSGKAKRAYKSWLAFLLALCVATGKTIGPLRPANLNGLGVLILEAEGGRAQTRNRWLYLAKGNGFDLAAIPNLYFSHRQNILLDEPMWIARIMKFIEEHNIKLVVVDPLAMFSRGNENNVQDVVKVMRSFVEFRRLGASTLFLHHLTKTDKEWARDIDEEIRGTSAIAGFYDSHLALRQHRDKQDYNELTVRSKDDEERQYEVRWYIDKVQGTASCQITAADPEAARGRMADELLQQLMPGETYTRKRLEELLGIEGAIGGSTIDGLVADNTLEKCGRGYCLHYTQEKE